MVRFTVVSDVNYFFYAHERQARRGHVARLDEFFGDHAVERRRDLKERRRGAGRVTGGCRPLDAAGRRLCPGGGAGGAASAAASATVASSSSCAVAGTSSPAARRAAVRGAGEYPARPGRRVLPRRRPRRRPRASLAPGGGAPGGGRQVAAVEFHEHLTGAHAVAGRGHAHGAHRAPSRARPPWPWWACTMPPASEASVRAPSVTVTVRTASGAAASAAGTASWVDEQARRWRPPASAGRAGESTGASHGVGHRFPGRVKKWRRRR